MSVRFSCLVCLAIAAAAEPAFAAGVREFTRPENSGTAVNPAQASELTLTLTEAAMRPIQTVVRTSGSVDSTGKNLTALLRGSDVDLVREGQRVRAFSVNSRTRMHLGRVERVIQQKDGARVNVSLPVQVPEDVRYLIEIVTERGPYLSIPNVSIIEEGKEQIVYLQREAGRYAPQAIKTGIQGELYTQVTEGLAEGDQIVSVGSFFIDAETKLKSGGAAAMAGMDHSQMGGMDHMDHGQTASGPASATGASSSNADGLSLVMTDPGAGARVSAPLLMIHVMFNQPVDIKSSAFEVTSGDGKRVDVSEAMAMGGDGTMLMVMPKTPLPKGSYRVKWHIVAINSQRLEGEFSFTVQ